jgi:putative phosphoesterase
MRIGLLSDTHIPEVTRSLPVEVKKAFNGVDLILHAGDIYNTSVLDELESIAPVVAAAGDDDYGATIADQRVQRRHILKLDGHTVLLIHERPYHPLVPQQASNGTQAEVDAPDIVVFGHEHRVTMLRHAGVLHINPGSPTFLHYNEGLGTVGILDLDSGEPSVRILQL